MISHGATGRERIEPARARPVCFCFQGLRPPPETSERLLVWAPYCALVGEIDRDVLVQERPRRLDARRSTPGARTFRLLFR